MKIKYLGTAAAEGVPAIFCKCDNCVKARALGGKNIRTRSQSIIDDKLIIDWPADAYMHMTTYGIDYSDISSILITHIHEDHFYPCDLALRRKDFAHVDGCPQLTIYGSEDLSEQFNKIIDIHQTNYDEDCPNRVKLSVQEPFKPFFVDGYKVTPLKAYHGTAHPFIYIIEKDNKCMLYGHDTDVFLDETWDYLLSNNYKFDLVSLDCTEGNRHISYHGHMCIERNIIVKDRMLQEGLANEKTIFVINHFSHNGRNVNYDEMSVIAKDNGFVNSYDGMEIKF